MKRTILLCFAMLAIGCGSNDIHVKGRLSGQTGTLTEIPEVSAYALASSIEDENLKVIPIVAKDKMPVSADMATLAEAKKNNWIEIIEMPGQEQVNQLQVRNTGPKPILLLAGELLLGGKQDRIIAKDTIVPTGQTQDVQVYCVEHGRWTEGAKFQAADTQVPQSVRDKAMYGDQQQVWDSVQGYNGRAGADPTLSTVNGGISTKQVQSRIQRSDPKLLDALKSNDKVVGAIFVVNGEVRTMELFGNHELFNNSIDSLLKGYLSEAAVGSNTAQKSFEMNDAVQFVKNTLSSQRKLTGYTAGSNSVNVDGEGTVGLELGTKDYEAKPSEGGKLEILHGSYKKK